MKIPNLLCDKDVDIYLSAVKSGCSSGPFPSLPSPLRRDVRNNDADDSPAASSSSYSTTLNCPLVTRVTGLHLWSVLIESFSFKKLYGQAMDLVRKEGMSKLGLSGRINFTEERKHCILCKECTETFVEILTETLTIPP